MLVLGLHPTSGGEAWESALWIDSPTDSYADKSLKLLSQRWQSPTKILKCIFPRKLPGIQTQVLPLTHSALVTILLPAKFLEENTCVQRAWCGAGAFALSPSTFWLYFHSSRSAAHTANMSEASGPKPSICCKKNEVFKQGLFGVGGCQVGWGLPGRIHHVETYKQISPGLGNGL